MKGFKVDVGSEYVPSTIFPVPFERREVIFQKESSSNRGQK